MSDIIQLLPDSIANQIAAGEVIQRPASVLKELMENAIDARASKIQVIIRGAGKMLIQVVDDGSGMSETDARMSFERHATSKLKKAEDLFAIRTMGFRGEALASIGAVAQVSLKTRLNDSDSGCHLRVEGSKIVSQEATAAECGTSVKVKNLFYNVPARRNFLKSDQVELRHILDEFQRTALANPKISFECFNDDKLSFQVHPGNIRQRIAGLFGKQYDEKIIPVEESTTIINISGFAGKPEFARRTRGEQFFFVNGRFIRDPYLHHAVKNAYEDLLPENSFPSYFLYFEIDPAQIDVNVHPTKTEIKFQDEKSIYAIVRASVKQALGKFNLIPSIDFNVEPSFDIPHKMTSAFPTQPQIKLKSNYNPFKEHESIDRSKFETGAELDLVVGSSDDDALDCFQFSNSFICCRIGNQISIIDQQRAHERILFERNLRYLQNKKGPSQQLLFPEQLPYNASDFVVMQELSPMLQYLGFDLSEFGAESFVLHGTPTWLEQNNASELIDHIIEQKKMHASEFRVDQLTWLATTVSRRASLKRGKKLSTGECLSIVEDLLQCENPNFSADGKMIIFNLDERFLNSQFNHKSIGKTQ